MKEIPQMVWMDLTACVQYNQPVKLKSWINSFK